MILIRQLRLFLVLKAILLGDSNRDLVLFLFEYMMTKKMCFAAVEVEAHGFGWVGWDLSSYSWDSGRLLGWVGWLLFFLFGEKK